MTLPMILAPLFVLVLMTFVIGFLLAGVRGPLLTRGEVRAEAVSLRIFDLQGRLVFEKPGEFGPGRQVFEVLQKEIGGGGLNF